MSIPAAALALVALVLPAAAQPLRPALKQAQCPLGYMQSAGYCMPMTRSPTRRPNFPATVLGRGNHPAANRRVGATAF